MSRNLIKLIQASGGGGGAGQTFRDDVTGAADGVRMTDYIISAMEFPGPGIPTSPGEEVDMHPSGSTFTFTADIPRGARATDIQRKVQAAFTFVLDLYDATEGGGAGAAVAITNFTVNGGGSSFTFTIRVDGHKPATPIVSLGLEMIGSEPIDWGTAWHGNWVPSVTHATVDGYGDYYLRITYAPDIGGFNPNLVIPLINEAFPIRVYDATWVIGDIDVYVWTVEQSAIDLSQENRIVSPFACTSYGGGHGDNVATTVWWRNRPHGGSWSGVSGPLGVTDTRAET